MTFVQVLPLRHPSAVLPRMLRFAERKRSKACGVRLLFAYFANVFSRNLSEKIKLGIKTQREKGTYRGGRPSKQLDVDRLRAIRLANPNVGWRMLTSSITTDCQTSSKSASRSSDECIKNSPSTNGQHTTHPN